MADSSRAMAWLELVRPPNLPTIAGNAVLGTWLGFLTQGRTPGVPGATWALESKASLAVGVADLATIARVAGGLCGLYVVGLILNDVFDLGIDRRERPHRPLPSGRVRVGHAVTAAVAVWMASLWLLGGFDAGGRLVLVASLVLTALIVAYDLLHTRASWAVVLPALCRGLAIVLAALATLPPIEPTISSAAWIPWQGVDWAMVLGPAGVVAIFVFSVSLVARREIAADDVAACTRCGRTLPTQATTCPACGGAMSETGPEKGPERGPERGSRIARVAELGRGPWWVVASGILCLVPAVGFGALLPTVVGAGAGIEQIPRDAATLLAFAAWLWTVTRWTPEMPVPRLVGRWLGSLCLLDAVMLSAVGPTPLLIFLGLHGIGRLLASRFAGS